MKYQDFLERLRLLRGRKKLKQSDMAELLSLSSSSHFSSMESGRTTLTVERFLKIADYMQLHPCEFFGEEAPKSGGGNAVPVKVKGGIPINDMNRSIYKKLITDAVRQLLQYAEAPKIVVGQNNYDPMFAALKANLERALNELNLAVKTGIVSQEEIDSAIGMEVYHRLLR